MKIILQILLLIALITTSQSAYYQNLQTQFNNLRLKSLLNMIPQTNTQQQLEQQLIIIEQLFNIPPIELTTQFQTYQRNYNQYLSSIDESIVQEKKKKWKPDPELSTLFNLGVENKAQSFIIKGQQLSKLVIDLTVTNTNPLDTKHDGILLTIINLSQISTSLERIVKQDWLKALKQTLNHYTQYKTQIRKHHFAVIPSFSSDIYQIVIFKNTKIGENFTDVHVSLQIKIQQEQVVNYNNNNQVKSLSPEQELQIVKNMKTITEQNQITFLDSLQLWQKIETHRKQNQSMLEWNSSIEWYECLAMVLLYTLEYGIFIFITKRQNVI